MRDPFMEAISARDHSIYAIGEIMAMEANPVPVDHWVISLLVANGAWLENHHRQFWLNLPKPEFSAAYFETYYGDAAEV